VRRKRRRKASNSGRIVPVNEPGLSNLPKGKGFGPWLGQQCNALKVPVFGLATAIGIQPADLHAVETGQNELGIGLQRKAVVYLWERAS
jgi:hypothetical protein